ncbi:MAG: LPXTG cell wall anchor domain-containing protein [Clostridium paraputrificum]
MKTNSKVNYKKGMVAATVATLLATYGVTTVGATVNVNDENTVDVNAVAVNSNAVVEEEVVEDEAVVEDVVDANVEEPSVTPVETVVEEVSSPSEEVDVVEPTAVAENTRSREVLPGTLWDYLPLGDYFHDEKNIAICSEIGGTTFYMVEIMKDDSMEIIQTFESKTTPMFDVIDGVSYFVVNAGNGYEVLSITIDGVTSRVPFKNGADTPARDVTFGKSVDGSFFVASLGVLDYDGLGTTYVSEYGSDLTYKGSYAIAPTVIDPIHFVDDVKVEGDKVIITSNGNDFTFDRVSGGDTEKPPVDTEKPPVDTEKPPVDTEKPPVDTEKPPVGGGETEKPPVDTEKPPVDTEKPPVGGGETEKPEPPVDGGNGGDNGNGGETEKPEPPVDTEKPQPPVDGGNQDNNGSSNEEKPNVPVNPSKPNDNTANSGTNNGTGNGSTQNVPTLPQTGQLPVGAFAGLASIFSGLGLFIKSKRK